MASTDYSLAVLLLDVSMEADAMVATDRIKRVADLSGKRVAYMRHEAPHFLLLSLCELHDLDVDRFEHIKVETAREAAELFVAGEVDAVVTHMNHLSNWLCHGAVRTDLPARRTTLDRSSIS